MAKRNPLRVVSLAVAVLLPLSDAAISDNGDPALRILCGKSSDRIEIEPFTAWDSGNSAYPFDFEASSKMSKMVAGETTFYSLSSNVFNYKKPFHHLCHTKTRTVDIKLYEAKLTVTEDSDAQITDLGFDGSFWPDVYYLTSESKGNWEECMKQLNQEERCTTFTQPINNNEDLVSFALHPDMIHSIERMLERGADINSIQKCSVTALHTAAAGGGVQMVKFLIEHGANVNARDCRGETPLATAKRTRSYTRDKDAQNKVIDYLLNNHAEE